MNLAGQLVVHKAFGEGKVIDHTGAYLSVLFGEGEKRFIYPDSFQTFLRAKDEPLHAAIQSWQKRRHKSSLYNAKKKLPLCLKEKRRLKNALCTQNLKKGLIPAPISLLNAIIATAASHRSGSDFTAYAPKRSSAIT